MSTFKYLVLWFDDKLIWKDHIDYILKLMRAVARQDWGADKQSLKGIYVGLIRSTLDYGSIIYESASSTLLKKLDVMQAKALRQILGAVITTPIAALQVETSEIPFVVTRWSLNSPRFKNTDVHVLFL